MCLSRRPRAQRAGDGAASAALSAKLPTCIKDKHTFYSQLSNLDGFEKGFRSDFSGKESNSFFDSIRGRYHGALEGMNG